MATDRGLWTIPNLISIARLAAIPVFLWLLWVADEPIAAAALLAVLGASDWVDGWVARRFDQVSEIGKILDPVADRALLFAAGIGLLVADVPGSVKMLAAIVLVREVIVSAVTIGLAAAGAARIDVVWSGKAGTLSVMFAFPLLLAADHLDGGWSALLNLAGWCFAAAGVTLSWYAAAQYLPAAREALERGRRSRRQRDREVEA